MNNFLLKNDEMMFFLDFNNTLVDYENEYDFQDHNWIEDRKIRSPLQIKFYLSKCLKEFRQQTGITPVICVVTNANEHTIDSNGYPGIFNDLRMTFFDGSVNPNQADGCEKYFKYLIYRENDGFFTINSSGKTIEEIFDYVPFDENALSIKCLKQFTKLESVERMMSVVDPDIRGKGHKSNYVLFAGDSIKDDYPMIMLQTDEGVSKIFIRPKEAKKITKNLMWQFCVAKGIEFTSVSKKSGRKIKVIDDNTYNYLNETDKNALENFADGNRVILTQKNSRGLMDGIRTAMEMISNDQKHKKNQKQPSEE
jgi:hypothetical protein